MSSLAILPIERVLVAQDTLHKLLAHMKDGLDAADLPDGYNARARGSPYLPDIKGLRELDARVWLDIFMVLEQQGMADHKARLALMLHMSYDLTLVR